MDWYEIEMSYGGKLFCSFCAFLKQILSPVVFGMGLFIHQPLTQEESAWG